MLRLIAVALLAAAPANTNAVDCFVSQQEAAAYFFCAQIARTVGQSYSGTQQVGRGEIKLMGRVYSYEYRAPGVYALSRGSGRQREVYSTCPSYTVDGDVWIVGGGSLGTLTLRVREGRLEVRK